MEKRWSLKENAEEEKIQELSEQLNGLNTTLCNLLIQRDIDTYKKAKAFFRPTMSALHDPFLMKDMNKAVERLQTAIKEKEHILIYGDYDVDGTTSVALVYSFLREVYPNLSYYIPDRWYKSH